MQFFTEWIDFFSRSQKALPNSLPHFFFFYRFKSKICDPLSFYFRQMRTADKCTQQFQNVIVILLDPSGKGHTIQVPFSFIFSSFIIFISLFFFSFVIEAAFSDDRGMQDDTPKKNVYVTVQELEKKRKNKTGFVKDLERETL